MAGVLIETSVTPPIEIDAGEILGSAVSTEPPSLAMRLLRPKVTFDVAPLGTKVVRPAGEPTDWRLGAIVVVLVVLAVLAIIGWIARRL